ncbi:MAG: leucine--tRNA ligase [Ignavibacteria bacterium]
MRYPYSEVEKKWQSYWEENKTYKTDFSKTDNKLYCLVMFIYPSGARLHCGHWYNYGPADSWARYKKLRGYNVFEPIGYDAFGLPAENYAIKTGVHPYDSTMKNIKDIRRQLKNMGNMYDWDAELMTCVPEYYKWNQWLFLQLYKRGLAYRKNAPVNWCPSCQTVLANEQVLADGSCERCGAVIIHKNLTQWFFKITEYAEELLSGLDTIKWPEKTRLMQRNWIGRSTGTEVKFKIEGHEEEITVFTTRPDTLFGVTYIVLAPEHPLVASLTTEEHKQDVDKYIDSIKSLSEIDRTSTTKEKTGVPTGACAVNPVNGERIPVWIADYALATYGTGCVMAVPGHDERDFAFASRFNLPIHKVILATGTNAEDTLTEAFTKSGTMINSGSFDGLNSDDCTGRITDYLESRGIGRRKVNYRLRDWLISRQRYWGTPIPIIHCPKCGEVPLEETALPLKLPYDVEFNQRGMSPLASNPEFMNVKCPECSSDALRDPDTMDTFVDSSWYYFRYLDPHVEDGMFNPRRAKEWAPVDMYVGGAEHATMHLLYSRFIHKFLRDIGLTQYDEPFSTLVHQGTITNNGAKMAKSKGNVVNPDMFIEKFGADVFRLYLMFMGPYEAGGDWDDTGIIGVDRFVQRSYDQFVKYPATAKNHPAPEKFIIAGLNEEEKSVYRKINQTINKYEDEIQNFRFNTAVASMMELVNELVRNLEKCRPAVQSYTLERFVALIAPVAPHLGEECWFILGKETSLFQLPVWYTADQAALSVDTVTIAVQVNGKLRATLNFPVDSEQSLIKEIIFAEPNVLKHTDGKTIVKEIYVKNKIYNIVVKQKEG